MLGCVPSRSPISSPIASTVERRERELLVVRALHPVGAVLRAEVQQQQRPCRRAPRSPSPPATPRSRRRSSGDPRRRSGRCSGPSRRPPASGAAAPRTGVAGAPRAAAVARGARDPATPRNSNRMGSSSRKRSSSSSRRPAIFSRTSALAVALLDAEVGAASARAPVAAAGSCRARRSGPPSRASPAARQRSANSKQSRLLPVPASATTPSTWPSPRRVRSSAASSVRISASRPTKRTRPRARERSKRVRARADARELVDVHRLGDALQRELAEVVEREVELRELRGVLGEVDAAARGERLHALREADRVPLRRVVHAQVVADLADHDLARVEADARREVEAVAALHVARELAQRVAQRAAPRSRRAARDPRARSARRTAP